MSFIAMSTNNPLGQRPFQQMGWIPKDLGFHALAGDFDFPEAPIPQRVAPEWLAGNAAKDQAIHPPAFIQELPSPWDADAPTMMLGAAAVTSTQTVVPAGTTTPQITSAVASGQPVWSAWFSSQTIMPGLSNWEVVAGAIAAIALLKAMK